MSKSIDTMHVRYEGIIPIAEYHGVAGRWEEGRGGGGEEYVYGNATV